MTLRHLDLFSGIGGFSLGLEATGGFETVAFCDIEEFPRKVLQKHWPHVKQYTDIKELNYEQLKADGLVPIDIITGGYPCQPFSVAGRKKGEEDPRHLWPEYFRLIKECRPAWVIGENVSGHLKLGLDTVLENLESEGYSVRTFSISASSIGANHQRERVWIVANSNNAGNRTSQYGINRNGEKINEGRERQSQSQSSRQGEDVENTRRTQRQGAFIREKNENEIGEENANQHQRSGSPSESNVANTYTRLRDGTFEEVQSGWQTFDTSSEGTRKDVADTGSKRLERSVNEKLSASECSQDVANTESISSDEREYRNHSQEKQEKRNVRGQSGNVANTKSEGLEGRGVNSTVTGGKTESSDSGPVSPNVANTKGSSGNVNEINGEHGETETQEIFGDGSGISRTQVGSPWEGWWDIEPDVGRVAHGVSARTHRLKGLGNSLVPAIPFHIGTAILEAMNNE